MSGGAAPATSRRRAAIGTFLSSGLNTLVLSIQALLLMPKCQELIGGRVYGAWLATGDVLYWIMAFDLGLPNLMIQRIGAAHGRGDRKEGNEYFATGIVFLGIVGIVMALTGLVVAPILPRSLKLYGEEAALLTGCIRLATVATSIVLASNAVLGYTRGVQKTDLFNLFSLLGTIAMFIVSLTTLLKGAGLWSIPFGLCTRAAFAVMGSLAVIFTQGRRGELKGFGYSKTVAREYLLILPASALGGVSYALMNQSESLLIGFLMGPEKVPIFNFTRKGAEVLRALIDTVAFSSYGAFAHLVGSDEKARSLLIHAQITTFRLSLAVGASAGYIALNHSFVTVWTRGEAMYGGSLLTVLIGAQIVAVGASNLMNYLYRATGQLMRGSLAQFGESLVRIPLMVAGILAFGYIGIPAVSILTSLVACGFLLHWTRQELRPFAEPAIILTPRYVAVLCAVFGAGILGAFGFFHPQWSIVLPVGGLTTVLAVALVMAADPYPIWKRRRRAEA